MGNSVYGQLGNPNSDGRPCLVEDKIASEHVLQIACGSYHVAVLTSRSEVFTWGKGANGRLGHGDIEDQKVPTTVEALRDRAVRHIACGANFTAANPGKLHRVCDSCYSKLKNASSSANKKDLAPGESNGEARVGNSILSSNMDMIRSLDSKAAKQGKKTDALSFLRNPQVSSLLQLRDIALSGGADLNRSAAPRAARTPAVRSVATSRAVSPSLASLVHHVLPHQFQQLMVLNQEVERLHAQVDSLRNRCDHHELELHKSAKKVQEAMI